MDVEQRPRARASAADESFGNAWLADGGRERTFLVIVVAGAFLLRVAHVLAMRATPFFDHPQMDALYHVEWARAVARGEDFQPGPFFRAPLYPWFLAGLFRLFGDGLLLPRLIQAAFGAASTALVWAIARRVFDRRTGLLAAAIVAIHWVSIFFDGELLLESLMIPLCLAGLWLTLRANDDFRPSRAALAGIVWGLAAITRPNVLALLPLLAAWLAWRHRRARGGLAVLAFVAGCAAPIAPITAYNWFIGHDLVLIASQGGVNLWIGNNPLSDGTSAVVPGTREDWWGGYRDAISLAERAEGRALLPSEVSRHYTHAALDFAREQPAAWLAGTARKLRWFAMDWELGNNEEVGFLVRRYSPIAAWMWLGWGLWLSLGIVGFFGARAASTSRFPVAAYALVYAATVVLFFVNARFRVPVMCVLAIFAARGVWLLLDLVRARRWIASALTIAAVASSYAVSRALVPAYMPALADSNGHQMLGNAAVDAKDWDAARAEYEASVERWDRNWISWRGLARCQLELGLLERSEGNYRRALSLREDDAIALSGLISVLSKQGRNEEAEREAERLIRVRPDSALGPNELGRVRFHGGDWVGAAQAFRLALEREPRDFNAAYSLGRALLELHDERAALESFETALSANEPEERTFLGDAFAQAIRLRLQFGDRARALELASRMRARLPDDPGVAPFLAGLGLGD